MRGSNRNRNIIKATQPQIPMVAYNGPTHRGELDYSRPRPSWRLPGGNRGGPSFGTPQPLAQR